MAILLVAAVLVDSKPPPQPVQPPLNAAVRSASTFRTNSRVVASWPCFRTEYGPWYQAASASVRFPLNSRSRWRRYATPIRMLPDVDRGTL